MPARAKLKAAWQGIDLKLLPGTTEGDILNALRKRYGPPEYAFLPHLRPGTGFSSTRIADAVVMNLWPSRGLELHGFEVKVSRSDWLSEYRNPAKADEMAAYCDRWWLVVADEALVGHPIVQPGELPTPWGLMTFDGKTLAYVKDAEKLPTPATLDRAFIAAMMRRTQESLGHEAAIEMAVADAEKRLREELKAEGTYELRQAREDLQRLTGQMKEFEEASGIAIGRWDNGKKIGEAVRTVMNASAIVNQLRRLNERLGVALKEADAISDEDPA